MEDVHNDEEYLSAKDEQHPLIFAEDTTNGVSEWDCSALEDRDIPQLVRGNAYVGKLYNNAGIRLLQEGRIAKSWRESRELGLLRLFMSEPLLQILRTWLNMRLKADGKAEVNMVKFNAYLGLQMATSLVDYNTLPEYWSTSVFAGHSDFKSVMPRDDFFAIRSHLAFHPDNKYTQEDKSRDPLWIVRTILKNLQQKCQQIAVPYGPCALDKNTIRTKARTSARSYIKGKLDPYGIRFYALVGWGYPYLLSLWDNGSGEKTNLPLFIAYIATFPELREVFNKFFKETDQTYIDKALPSAIRAMQVVHLAKKLGNEEDVTDIFTDSFSTRQNLANYVHVMTQGKVRITKTVGMNFVDATNKLNVTKAMAEMEDSERGIWKLVAAFNAIPNLQSRNRKHKSTEARFRNQMLNGALGSASGASSTSAFETPMGDQSPNAGYIVFKDSKVVVFYTKILAETPSHPILDGTDPEAQTFVHGIAGLHR